MDNIDSRLLWGWLEITKFNSMINPIHNKFQNEKGFLRTSLEPKSSSNFTIETIKNKAIKVRVVDMQMTKLDVLVSNTRARLFRGRLTITQD